jgi:peptidoglycan hydrolase-like protein with peptidoglycan-binding domain
MKRSLLTVLLAALIIIPLALFGCKGRTEKMSAEMRTEATEAPGTSEAPQVTAPITEPAQTVATETIPPTAAPQISEKPAALPAGKLDRNKDIQTALKNSGFYSGTIDGKLGPKTKKAIEEFQKSKGLKADGKVGPKTWAEMEKYLAQQ